MSLRRAELVVGQGRFAVGAAAQELEDDLGGAVRRGRVQLVPGAHLADAIAGGGRGGQEGAWAKGSAVYRWALFIKFCDAPSVSDNCPGGKRICLILGPFHLA